MKNRIEEVYKPNELTEDLMTNEDEINKTKEAEKTNWDYVFGDAADEEETDQQGKYRMRDVDTPATYETEVDYYDPTSIQIETEITGQKRWLNDQLSDRPQAITIYLFANGEEVAERTVTARTDWSYRFTNIPVYDADGEKIMYSVQEKPLTDYKTSYEGFDIMNKRINHKGDAESKADETVLGGSRATRIGLFVLGAAAITAGLLIDQLRKED